jgi:hypothetical protein
MNLPALLLSKNFIPDSLRASGLTGGPSVGGPEPFSVISHKKEPIKYETRRRAPGTITHMSDSARCSTFLACANKAPHYRICTLDYFRPDCESPARFDTLDKPRTIWYLTIITGYVKALQLTFSCAFPHPCGSCANRSLHSFTVRWGPSQSRCLRALAQQSQAFLKRLCELKPNKKGQKT